MAGNKQVPLRWGDGGPIIGTATIDENGLIMGEIEDQKIYGKIFGQQLHGISVYTKENADDN